MKLEEIEERLKHMNLKRDEIATLTQHLMRHKERLILKQDLIHELESQLAIIASQCEEPKTIEDMISYIENRHQVDTLSKLLTRDDDARIYLSDYNLNVKNMKDVRAIFTVLGSIRNETRDTYQIKLFNKGSFYCNCPDHKFNSSKKRIVCKHICFLLCKVAKMLDPEFFITRQFTESQLIIFLSRIENKKKILDDRSLSKAAGAPVFNNFSKDIKPDEPCPICFEEMAFDNIVSCPTCTNYVHKQCILVWLERNSTCVYCRSKEWRSYKA